ncbi:MAG: L-threonine 3-dehydrogenase [Actinomycetia bacterium]|nr:L-threonine 3-dehydrogenase [Actinomycetes bacterium]
MRALVKTAPGPGLELIEVARPTCGAKDVLVEVTHAAVCGTDLHINRWDDWAASTLHPPVTIGHEFVGVVVEAGDQVLHVAVGDRVVGEGHIVCETCRNCRAGDGHLCRNTVGIGIHRDGGFADFIAFPATNAYKVPDSVPDEIAAILDPLGNAVHTALSFDLIGEDVLITGAGPIGQMAAAICRHAGARHVVITDPSPARLATATRMGADLAVSPGEEGLRDAMSTLGMVEGFDVALEMSGQQAALADIVATINHGGHVGLLGLFADPPRVDLTEAIFKGLTIKGIYGREMFDTWYKATAMLESGLDIGAVVSHRLALSEFADAFDLLERGDASKIVLDVRI